MRGGRRRLYLRWQRHLVFVTVAPVDPCPCPGSQVLNREFAATCSEDHQARSGWAAAPPSVQGWAGEGQAPLCCSRSGAEWDVTCALKIEVPREGVYCRAPQMLFPSEKKFLLNHTSFHVLRKVRLHRSSVGPLSHVCRVFDWNTVKWRVTAFRPVRLCTCR